MSVAENPQEHWEGRYAEKPQMWSGRVNAHVATFAGDLTPGRALDLGCGEGGDAVWLAANDWQVVAVDIATNALDRARAAAEARGVAERIDFQHHDLSASFPAGSFDLVSAQFLHSTVRLERGQILQNAAAAVAVGGTLLIVDHGEPPPWASQHLHDHRFQSPEEVLSELGLPEEDWQPQYVGTLERDAAGPAGESAILRDNLIVLRRTH
ncbi:class I SAM-dependent methyltransferase [Mycobacterium sp. CBMA293]|uniref:class I SAM-dependent methyltransferase n=1 Tax=unclassified Mycolicibacterium TaxID=2636767 RepID=UPI0012DC3957|nr:MULTISPECIES: class I SAM-dependent methyltransferase [unclassified Mycolicibacterium]MUL45556.1 class I SAM-dependent methyltransferase [Mycolicibacterium sp. CBMA 360]MUL60226.1 class I SAM-dependent methyltransferase [Mycolicibacterium sp. CBMA 335]MUL71562.1 class I SAM-dependent methyltransferase [Mycolicibacterium sp. CBMA 311]MUL73013.1 class I SAM-dependent methyltransferase [Mycolicibacterium sp. CBMA 311]MUL96012.1 class I SAM-dependent methyltransferase [Mycolicibacterium sp. CBM